MGSLFGMTGGYHGSTRSGPDSFTSSSAASEAARASSQAMNAKKSVRALQANLAKTMMICEALWEMLRDEHGYTEEMLHQKLYEIDMRDGVLDGKNQQKPGKCPDCDHMISPRHPACIYCGYVVDKSVFTIE